jgi:hypothetical protein
VTATDTLELKKKMLQASIIKQEALINDFKTRIENILDTAGLGNEEEYDDNELSQKAQASEEINSLNEGLSLANEEMTILQSLWSSVSTNLKTASPGAVVVTNRDTFLISVSTEQFEVDGRTFNGISVKSPLYLAMKGKRKGEKFTCRGLTYKILAIF